MPNSYQLRPPPTGTALDAVEVERYDPYTDSWAPVRPALKYVSNFSAASCQGRLYLVGSSACKYNMLALQCYSPVTGRKASLVACTPEVTSSSGWGWGRLLFLDLTEENPMGKCGLDICRGSGAASSLWE